MFDLNYYKRLFSYLMRMVRKVLRFDLPSIERSASEYIILCAAEEGVQQPAVTVKGQLTKATGNYFGDLSTYIEYATSLTAKHAATEVYRIENVTYDNGYLYKGFIAEHVSSLGLPSHGVAHQVESMLLCSTPSGSRYFGDWLVADNCRELLAREMNIEPLKIRPHTQYIHLPELNKILGLRETYNEGTIFIKNLYVTNDQGYNANKRARCNELRSNLRKNIVNDGKHNQMIYIGRGSSYSSGRGLINEAEVIEYLSSIGFLIIDPTQTSAIEILEKTINCSVVVGIEGSQLAYGFLALKEGGLMLTLQPPYHFQSAFRPRCDAVGVRWGFVVGVEQTGGFDIDVKDVADVLKPWK